MGPTRESGIDRSGHADAGLDLRVLTWSYLLFPETLDLPVAVVTDQDNVSCHTMTRTLSLARIA